MDWNAFLDGFGVVTQPGNLLYCLIGVVIGNRLASTRDSTSLQRWFVVLLAVVATYTALQSGAALL